MDSALLLAATMAERGQWWPDSLVGRLWVVFGFAAQAVFAGRFLVQWIASERRRKSHMPVSFWYMSLVGGVMLFTYAVHKRDVVFALGQSTGCIVYIRNLMLLSHEKKLLQGAGTAKPDG